MLLCRTFSALMPVCCWYSGSSRPSPAGCSPATRASHPTLGSNPGARSRLRGEGVEDRRRARAPATAPGLDHIPPARADMETSASGKTNALPFSAEKCGHDVMRLETFAHRSKIARGTALQGQAAKWPAPGPESAAGRVADLRAMSPCRRGSPRHQAVHRPLPDRKADSPSGSPAPSAGPCDRAIDAREQARFPISGE